MRQVLCFGDSNTHGTVARPEPGSLDRHPEADRWPAVAAEALGQGWRLIAEGQPGRTTVHPDPVEGGQKAGIMALPVLLESHRPLHAVVVMLGTNDLKRRFSASAADIALGVEQLVDCVEKSRAGPEGSSPRCLVVAPVPIVEVANWAEVFQGGPERSRALAAALGTTARRRRAAFVDAGAVAEVDPVDGIHLDPAAHAAIGRAVAAKLAEMLE